MRLIRDILLAAIAWCATACIDEVDDIAPRQEVEYVNLYIRTGTDSPASTRSLATHGENRIHDVKVWAFGEVEVDGVAARRTLGYAGKDFDHDPTGATNLDDFYQYLRLAIPKAYIESGNLTADFYFLANCASIGQEGLDENTTEETLKALQIGTQYFGGNVNISSFSIAGNEGIPTEGKGLPISRVLTSVPVSELVESLTPLHVVMRRAVSRLRFFFAQDSSADALRVTGITIGDGSDLLLSNEAVFPEPVAYTEELARASRSGVSAALNAWEERSGTTVRTPDNATITYTQDQITAEIDAGMEINKVDNLGDRLVNEYERATDDGKPDWLAANATLANVTYLRESDAGTLPVTIHYTIGGQAWTPLRLEIPIGTTAMLRNHEVNVFGYLKGKELYVKPLLQDWTEAHELSYTTKGRIEIGIYSDGVEQSYKIYNPTPGTGGAINWNNAYVGVSERLVEDEEDGLVGQPLFSPMLHLRTAYGSDLKLVCDNPEFAFIEVVIDEGNNRSISNYLGDITIASGSADTYFYVVPRQAYGEETNHAAHVYLIDTADNTRQPINPSFMPGPANIAIWFYHMESEEAYRNLNDHTP